MNGIRRFFILCFGLLVFGGAIPAGAQGDEPIDDIVTRMRVAEVDPNQRVVYVARLPDSATSGPAFVQARLNCRVGNRVILRIASRTLRPGAVWRVGHRSPARGVGCVASIESTTGDPNPTRLTIRQKPAKSRTQ